jgi:predicted dehydrogenase
LETVRLAQVGTGDWGANLVRNFATLPGAELRLLCDTDPERLARAARVAPSARTTSLPDEVAADADIQAVVVAAPAASHFELTRQFLSAGKDVYVEKPMTLHASEAEELVQLADQGERILMVGHLLLYHPAVQRLTQILADGELGALRYIYSQRTNLGKVRRDENALWSFAPHDLAVLLHFIGEEPTDVSARGEAFLQEGVEDVVFLDLRFPGGQLGHVHVSWLDPHKVRRFTVVGSQKMAVFDDQEPTEKLRVYDKGVDAGEFVDYARALAVRSGDIWIPRLDSTEPLKLECRHFVECVRERKAPVTDGREGLRVIRVLEAATQSLEQGGAPIRLQPSPALAGARQGGSA